MTLATPKTTERSVFKMAFAKMNVLTISLIFCAFLAVNGQKKVIELNEENWKDMLTGEWMVEFFAPWCPACKGLQPTWTDFASLSPGLGIKVGQVDVTTSPGLSGRFMVTALPTIFHVLNGEFRQYKGTRDKEAFLSFIEERKWQQVEPVPKWKAPDSVQMSVVSSFFKLSQILRHIHTHLMEEFGLPTWGSYLIFAVATIFLGAILGLVLVCVIDFIYPPKALSKSRDGRDKNEDKDSGDELGDEDIKDDLLDDASQSEGEQNSQSDADERSDGAAGDSSAPNSPSLKKRRARRAD